MIFCELFVSIVAAFWKHFGRVCSVSAAFLQRFSVSVSVKRFSVSVKRFSELANQRLAALYKRLKLNSYFSVFRKRDSFLKISLRENASQF